METAKVDIRKLQVLNDRINQCIDALNQVRLSVHGLSHTTGSIPGVGMSGIPGQQAFGGYPSIGQVPGLGHSAPGVGLSGLPWQGVGVGYPQVGQGPFGAIPFGPQMGGLWHSSAFSPYAGLQTPFTPFAASLGQVPFGVAQSPFLGLSHTSPEALGAADPFLAVRIAQTFPYAQLPIPPVISLY